MGTRGCLRLDSGVLVRGQRAELSGEQKPCFVAFADFQGVPTPMMVRFKLQKGIRGDRSGQDVVWDWTKRS